MCTNTNAHTHTHTHTLGRTQCGVFDQDLSAAAAMKFPQCYVIGREKKDLNIKVIAVNFLQATIEGTVIYYMCRIGLQGAGKE